MEQGVGSMICDRLKKTMERDCAGMGMGYCRNLYCHCERICSKTEKMRLLYALNVA